MSRYAELLGSHWVKEHVKHRGDYTPLFVTIEQRTSRAVKLAEGPSVKDVVAAEICQCREHGFVCGPCRAIDTMQRTGETPAYRDIPKARGMLRGGLPLSMK